MGGGHVEHLGVAERLLHTVPDAVGLVLVGRGDMKDGKTRRPCYRGLRSWLRADPEHGSGLYMRSCLHVQIPGFAPTPPEGPAFICVRTFMARL